MSAELIGLVSAAGAALLVFLWKKWGKDLLNKAPDNIKDLVEENIEELKDGELTEEEIKKRLEEVLK